MGLFKFEYKKFTRKYLWLVLILIPVVTVLGTAIFNHVNPPMIINEESKTANRLLLDLNWSLPQYQEVLESFSEDEINSDPELEQMQVIYEHLDEAEKARFHYSVAAWHEDWQLLNESKQIIWDNLIKAREEGASLSSLDSSLLSTEKNHIDWLVNNNIDYIVPYQSTQSQFVLNQSLSILFSLPAIMIIVFFIGLSIFSELGKPQKKFAMILPIKPDRILINKLILYLLNLMAYISGTILSVIFLIILSDDINLITQWKYPLVSTGEEGIIRFTLGSTLIFKILFFILLSILILLITVLLSRFIKDLTFILILITTVSIIGIQLTQISPSFYQVYNPFAWLDLNNTFNYLNSNEIILSLLIITCIVIFLIWFINKINIKSSTHPFFKTLQLKPSSRLFLTKFELIKIGKQKLYFYAFLIVLINIVFMINSSVEKSKDSFTQLDTSINVAIEGFSNYLETVEVKERYQELNEREQELVDLVEKDLARYQLIKSQISNNNYALINEMNDEAIQNDYLFLLNQMNVSGTDIPIRNPIFMPNAAINFEVMNWKNKHDIDFVVPGGPFFSEYLPEYQDSPQSGEGEPPFGIDIIVFQQYLDNRQNEHWTFTGLNTVLDYFNHYIYLVPLIISVLFFSTTYAREWDGVKNIRFMITNPVSIKNIVKGKMGSAIISSLLTNIIALFLLLIIASLFSNFGQLKFPVVEYLPASINTIETAKNVISVPLTRQLFTIVPIWIILLRAMGLLLSAALFVTLLTLLISVIVKNSRVSIGLSVITVALGILVSLNSKAGLVAYNPFTYLNIPAIISGKYATQINLVSLNYKTGILLLIFSSIVLGGLAIWMTRKDNYYDRG